MLSLTFMSFSLLLLPLAPSNKRWYTTTFSLMLISMLSLLKLYPLNSSMSLSSSIFSIDFLSSPLITLTFWISSLMLLASFPILINSVAPNMFLFMLSSLNFILLMTFSMNNFLLFYICFEASLIPTLFMILGWGAQPERLQASFYFILYTVMASLPLLLSLMFIFKSNNTLFMLSPHWQPATSNNLLFMWWLMSITAFMVKMPLYSTHLWLPKAHVEAPVAGSMILAGLLLKLGSYGLIRIAILFPHINMKLLPLMAAISMWGAIVTSMICIRQTDIKALIAYSSVGHMGLVVAASMTNTTWGWEGALIMMLAHGLCSSALFAMANMTYETTHTRSLFLTKGLLSFFPAMTMMWFIMLAANMAAPPTLNLAGEIIMLTSILSASSSMMFLIALTSFLAGAYSLFLYTSTQHGAFPNFMGPLSLFSTRNFSVISLHAIPLIFFILKSDIIMNWLS
uniref:NADH-ubiquinone oxidoreductase chain 4 n=1 Tax=Melinna cristata TaxID=222004 RepID=A0A8A4VMG8_9ANNE|nr:NADH dehydrogenase subunit 4 [Melinna cristata]QTD82975.1 NADH dehydrogenase subunit 4 [Melinna cristata]